MQKIERHDIDHPLNRAQRFRRLLNRAQWFRRLAENEEALIDAGHDPTWHGPERQRLLRNAERCEEIAKELLLQEKRRAEYERRRKERVPLSERSEERGNEPEPTQLRLETLEL